MASQKKAVIAALVIASIMMIASVLALLTSTKTIPSSGTISAFKVGVYSDAECTIPLTAIAFGSVSPSYNTNQTMFIKNDSPSGGKSLSLSMTIPNWNAVCTPLNTTYNVVTFVFNQTGTVLAPTNSVAANITMTALENAETQAGLSFTSLSINIIGTEVQT
jgi:hypothetical protein